MNFLIPNIKRENNREEKILKDSRFEILKNSFRLTFTSLSLILLTFFIYFHSIAIQDTTKAGKVFSSIAKAFNIKKTDKEGLESSDKSRSKNLIPVITQNIVQNELLELQSTDGLTGDIEIMENKNDLIINLSDKLIFDLGKSNIKESFKPTLNKVIKILGKIDNKIRVEGYTDNTPISNSNFESNWELSAARAIEILRYLHQQGNVSLDRLEAAGYGEFHPIMPNDTPQGKIKNRRVAIVICNAKGLDKFGNYGKTIKIQGFKFRVPDEEIDELY